MDDSGEKQEQPVAPGETRSGQKLLTGKQWSAITLAVFTIVLTAIVNIGVREYYQPDVRYEEGTWYYSGGKGIISLRIKNYGAADAEKIAFTVSFDETISNASVNDPTVECRFKDQTDPKTVTGQIERLVPKQTTLVYYDVGPTVVGRVFKEGPFVRSMVYNGGMGRTGEPRLLRLLLTIPMIVAIAVLGAVCTGWIALWYMRRQHVRAFSDWKPTGEGQGNYEGRRQGGVVD